MLKMMCSPKPLPLTKAGSKEGVENFSDILRRDALAIILHRQANVCRANGQFGPEDHPRP